MKNGMILVVAINGGQYWADIVPEDEYKEVIYDTLANGEDDEIKCFKFDGTNFVPFEVDLKAIEAEFEDEEEDLD